LEEREKEVQREREEQREVEKARRKMKRDGERWVEWVEWAEWAAREDQERRESVKRESGLKGRLANRWRGKRRYI
jgi:hypothetical protein